MVGEELFVSAGARRYGSGAIRCLTRRREQFICVGRGGLRGGFVVGSCRIALFKLVQIRHSHIADPFLAIILIDRDSSIRCLRNWSESGG